MFTLAAAAPADAESILPLDQVKLHLRIDDEDGEEDYLVASLRASAIDWIERHCGVALTRRTWTWTGDGFGDRCGGGIRLPIGPVASVESVAYLDGAGATVTLTTGDWRLSGARIVPGPGKAWPAPLAGPGAVTAAFTAGYADARAEAPALIPAALMLIGALYANREAAVLAAAMVEVPFGVLALCNPYRSPVL